MGHDGGEQVVVVAAHRVLEDDVDLLAGPAFLASLALPGTHYGEGVTIETDEFQFDWFRKCVGIIHNRDSIKVWCGQVKSSSLEIRRCCLG